MCEVEFNPVASSGLGSIKRIICTFEHHVHITAHYIADAMGPSGVQVTTLAQGVPIGGELDYLDDGTIGAALRARRKL